MAAQHGHGALAADLLERGARPNATTARGFAPLMLACLYNQQDLLINLLDRGVHYVTHCSVNLSDAAV